MTASAVSARAGQAEPLEARDLGDRASTVVAPLEATSAAGPTSERLAGFVSRCSKRPLISRRRPDALFARAWGFPACGPDALALRHRERVGHRPAGLEPVGEELVGDARGVARIAQPRDRSPLLFPSLLYSVPSAHGPFRSRRSLILGLPEERARPRGYLGISRGGTRKYALRRSEGAMGRTLQSSIVLARGDTSAQLVTNSPGLPRLLQGSPWAAMAEVLTTRVASCRKRACRKTGRSAGAPRRRSGTGDARSAKSTSVLVGAISAAVTTRSSAQLRSALAVEHGDAGDEHLHHGAVLGARDEVRGGGIRVAARLERGGLDALARAEATRSAARTTWAMAASMRSALTAASAGARWRRGRGCWR